MFDSIDTIATVSFFNPVRAFIGSGSQLRIPILMYHSVSSEQEGCGVHPYYRTVTSPEAFALQMRFLAEKQYSVLPLAEAVRRMNENAGASEKACVITFDDGFLDFYSDAYPILSEHGFTASVFVATDYIGDGAPTFNGKRCLSWKHIRELEKAGISFGSHTASHPKLVDIDTDQRAAEVTRSKQTLEDHLGSPVDSFAYPYAFPEHDRRFIQGFRAVLKRAGFTHGVSTILGTATHRDDVFFLKRLPVNSRDDARLLNAKLEGGYDWLHGLQYAAKLLSSNMIGSNK